eukprot:TRINITY_DN1506_c0_g1_i1.p1 TRINITY_DN1506_c0_g1~~TRINITY_DN1506_c0_g1_i1.p1  ORF type:complete len:291 (+),score=96.88 TRINITY_DN1506_c0_g1_i1:51-875(+)
MNSLPHHHQLHAGYSHPLLRSWNNPVGPLHASQFIYPIFVTDKQNTKEEISSLPNQYQISVDLVVDFLTPLVKKGLRSIILFGVLSDNSKKDPEAKCALDVKASPVLQVLPLLRKAFPDLCLVTDVCLCAYTSHGHCGVLSADNSGFLDLDKSNDVISSVALAYAQAGSQVVAPSDMMDGRIHFIKKKLIAAGLGNRVAVMSYSAKFASCFYGPFRAAANSSPTFGDRRCYQLPPAASKLALKATLRDEEEGADIVMVKPATPFLDIIAHLERR